MPPTLEIIRRMINEGTTAERIALCTLICLIVSIIFSALSGVI